MRSWFDHFQGAVEILPQAIPFVLFLSARISFKYIEAHLVLGNEAK